MQMAVWKYGCPYPEWYNHMQNCHYDIMRDVEPTMELNFEDGIVDV
jgi:hypothetical protein